MAESGCFSPKDKSELGLQRFFCHLGERRSRMPPRRGGCMQTPARGRKADFELLPSHYFAETRSASVRTASNWSSSNERDDVKCRCAAARYSISCAHAYRCRCCPEKIIPSTFASLGLAQWWRWFVVSFGGGGVEHSTLLPSKGNMQAGFVHIHIFDLFLFVLSYLVSLSGSVTVSAGKYWWESGNHGGNKLWQNVFNPNKSVIKYFLNINTKFIIF